MAYTPDPRNPHPQSSREHWVWFHANDPHAPKPGAAQKPASRMQDDSNKRKSFWGGGK